MSNCHMLGLFTCRLSLTYIVCNPSFATDASSPERTYSSGVNTRHKVLAVPLPVPIISEYFSLKFQTQQAHLLSTHSYRKCGLPPIFQNYRRLRTEAGSRNKSEGPANSTHLSEDKLLTGSLGTLRYKSDRQAAVKPSL